MQQDPSEQTFSVTADGQWKQRPAAGVIDRRELFNVLDRESKREMFVDCRARSTEATHGAARRGGPLERAADVPAV